MAGNRGRGTSGSGSIRKRADGRWEGRYTAGRDPKTGRQIQRSIYGRTQKEVREKLRKITAELDAGSYQEPASLTVEDWAKTWIEFYLIDDKIHTRKSYVGIVNNHIIPVFGKQKLQKLDLSMIQKWIHNLTNHKDIDRPLSSKTIKNIHGVLHSMLEQAKRVGYIRENPASGAVLPRRKKPVIFYLEEFQLIEFLAAIKGHLLELLYVVAVFTGLRQSEILGLQWRDIDFETGVLFVRRQYQFIGGDYGGYQYSTPKNGMEREIPLPQKAVNALLKQKEQQRIWAAAAGAAWSNPDGIVFTNPLGQHLKHDFVYRHLKRIFKSMGLHSLRFHDLRHTYAVMCIQSGDDFKVLQEKMGHYSIEFTLDTYGHISRRMRRESAEKIDRFVESLEAESAFVESLEEEPAKGQEMGHSESFPF